MTAIRVSKNQLNKILKNVNQQSIEEDKQIKGGYMKNKLVDLNNHLFEQLERLNDEDLSQEELDKEVKRTKAITSIATNIINNGNLILNSYKFAEDNGLVLEKDIDPTKLIGD